MLQGPCLSLILGHSRGLYGVLGMLQAHVRMPRNPPESAAMQQDTQGIPSIPWYSFGSIPHNIQYAHCGQTTIPSTRKYRLHSIGNLGKIDPCSGQTGRIPGIGDGACGLQACIVSSVLLGYAHALSQFAHYAIVQAVSAYCMMRLQCDGCRECFDSILQWYVVDAHRCRFLTK